MIPEKHIELVYFIGIGGIGMSALARYYNRAGKIVMGYDKTPSPLTTELEMEGIAVHFSDTVHDLPTLVRTLSKEAILVVYTPAIPSTHNELNWFINNEYRVLKRSEVLGNITRESSSIAIAGTHGKTTTSSLTAHIMHASGKGCNAFLGGIA
ncbi:MAG: hypothetical protein RL226_2061, partial [Bacteroidota bacterium]